MKRERSNNGAAVKGSETINARPQQCHCGRSLAVNLSKRERQSMTAKQQYGLEATPKCVLADGPYETDGDGGFEYCVCFGDDEGEPITENKRCVWHLWEFEEVRRFAFELGRKYGLEVVLEAMEA